MPKHLKLTAACCLLVLYAPTLALAANPDHVYLQVHVDVDKAGHFYDTEPVTMTVPQATAAGCVAFTGDAAACEALAPAMGGRAHTDPHDKLDGSMHSGIFRSPFGYDICRVRIEGGRMTLAGDASFAATILRNTDSLGPPNDASENGLAYAIDAGAAGSDRAVTAIVDLDFVPAKAAADAANACFPTGAKPWDCKGTGDACIEAPAKG